jgi:hypothetical protein
MKAMLKITSEFTSSKVLYLSINIIKYSFVLLYIYMDLFVVMYMNNIITPVEPEVLFSLTPLWES